MNNSHFSQFLKLLVLLTLTSSLYAQTPNPYRNVDWATLPDGRTWGGVGDLDVMAERRVIRVSMCKLMAAGRKN